VIRSRARRCGGFLVVGAVLAATLVTAVRGGGDAPAAAAVDATPATAWLPDPVNHRVVLADGLTGRAVTVVPTGLSNAPTTSLAQVGGSAVLTGSDLTTVVHGPTWRATVLNVGGASTAFVAAGASRAWLISPRADTAQPVDIAAAARLSDGPTTIGTAVAPRSVRVGDDGTLWVLGPRELRSFAAEPDRPSRVLPLDGPPADRVLTLVDGEPVIVGPDGAAHVDPQTATVDRRWPVGPTGGPFVAAERSRTAVVVRVGTVLTVSGPDRDALTVELDRNGDYGTPVELDGLVYVPDQTSPAVLVVDTRPGVSPRQRLVRRIAVAASGPISLFAHNRRVWYTTQDPEGSAQAGVIDDHFGARTVVTGEQAELPGAGPSSSGAAPTPAAGPAAPSAGPVTPVVAVDERATPCARTWPTERCLPDTGPEPFSRVAGAPSSPDCPHAWPLSACRPAGESTDTGPGGRAGGPNADFGWYPDPPGAGIAVTFTANPGDGERRWSFDGGSPGTAVGPQVTTVFPAAGLHRVTLMVDGPAPRTAVHDVVVVDGHGLPPIIGLTATSAADALRGLQVTIGSTRERPALAPAGTIVGVSHHGVTLQPGDAVQPGWALDIEVSDGSRPVKAVAGSLGHACVLVIDGSVACWGKNSAGELGSGTGADSSRPVTVQRLGSASAIVTGEGFSCALLVDRTVACWGAIGPNPTGDGTIISLRWPVAVKGLEKVVQLSAQSGGHACALVEDGSVWCWGLNNHGELGREGPGYPPEPVRVEGIGPAVRVSAGWTHSCAVVTDTSVWCWGQNDSGQLGNGASGPDVTHPVRVQGLTGARDVAAGAGHSCAVLGSGTVSCWGALTRFINLGTEEDGNSPVPVPVPGLHGVQEISAGTHTCARTSEGLVSCWGTGASGQRADASWTAYLLDSSEANLAAADLRPTTVVDVFPAVAIGTGFINSFAVRDDGELFCWGINPTFQLGVGDINKDGILYAPTRVRVD
jgi:alpha-tubulin suppressor-like RCC1 family protein